jgi:hypothetical protein
MVNIKSIVIYIFGIYYDNYTIHYSLGYIFHGFIHHSIMLFRDNI